MNCCDAKYKTTLSVQSHRPATILFHSYYRGVARGGAGGGASAPPPAQRGQTFFKRPIKTPENLSTQIPQFQHDVEISTRVEALMELL